MPEQNNKLLIDLSQEIAGQADPVLPLPLSTTTLDDTSSHDFLAFQYLLDPADVAVFDATKLSKDASNYIAALAAAGASPELLQLTIRFLAETEAVLRVALRNGLRGIYRHAGDAELVAIQGRRAFTSAVIRLYGEDRDAIPGMVDLYVLDPSRFLQMLAQDLERDARAILRSRWGSFNIQTEAPHHDLMRDPDQPTAQHPPDPRPEPRLSWSWSEYLEAWRQRLEQVPGRNREDLLEYPFEVFPPRSTNVGIALTYRQTWRLLGTQPGEIVKTIPLGPGQKEKVATKITRRRKANRTMSTSTESESSTEESDTTKDSTEILLEATNTKEHGGKVQIDVGGVASFGIGGSASAHMNESESETTKGTTSGLSEAMRKTAQRIKRESKASVVTESEFGFEEESSSEISNPNDEIAVTYCYHTLQRQYEVHTRLAEVRNCVFVAEALPLPHEIGAEWVRRHDYIIARVLLDDSFIATLTELSTETDDPEHESVNYGDMLTKAEDSFASFSVDGLGGGDGAGGLSIPDIYSEPQRLHDQHLRDEANRDRENRLRRVRRNRLFQHIRQNILHYCRAIWLAEDVDQRLLRYRKEARTVPLVWTADNVAADESLDAKQFEPADVEVPLTDVIDQSGPIGTMGNYLVFALRSESHGALEALVTMDAANGTLTLPLQDVLDLLRAPFSDSRGTLVDPARGTFADAADNALTADPDLLSKMDDKLVRAILSHLPELRDGRLGSDGQVLRDSADALSTPFTREQYVDYLMRRAATRRFLVDSNNLYLSLHRGAGTALEPFKRAHRYIDVLKAAEERRELALRNARRESLKDDATAFDPDIAKVIVVPDGFTAADVVGRLDDD
jgi:hypothetical protein